LRVEAVEFNVAEPDVVDCDVLVYNAFVENGQRVNVGDALIWVNAVVTRMQAKGDGAILFSTYARSGESAVRALVQRLAEADVAFGIRVGMVTIDGALPTDGTELASIANMYWDLFFSPDRLYEREVRVRTGG